MPNPYCLDLTPAQRHELVDARDHHPRPYIREHAAAILKVADGQSIRHVAAHGLLKPRRRETIKAWIDRYQAAGLPGLQVHDGRGRKPAFFPPLPRCGDGSR